MIRKAENADLTDLAALCLRLWPEHRTEELEEEFRGLLNRKDAACFLAFAEGRPVGFAQCQLRYDYVEGTETSPVGYLEGIFVAGEHRRRGLGRMLAQACEDWARGQGCREFASDCELSNEMSLGFHLALGFGEAGRIICFSKRL